MKFKTRKSRIRGMGLMAATMGLAAFGFIYGVVDINSRSTVFAETLVIFSAFFFFSTFSILISSGFEISKEEEEAKEKKKHEERLLANATIVAEAIAKCYPYVLLSDPMPYDVTFNHILHDHVLPAVKHYQLGHLNYLECVAGGTNSGSCAENVRVVSDSIRMTLTILAQKFATDCDAQETHQTEIDKLAKAIHKNQELSRSPDDVENLFAQQKILDRAAKESKELFWKVHGAAKAIGENVYPKRDWYLLLWRGLGR